MIASVLFSRLGIAVMVAAAALGWHYIDKAAAVRGAQEELADKVQIGTLQAQLAAANQRALVAKAANENLIEQIEIAEIEADTARIELDQYAENFAVNADCAVDGSVLERLRNR